MGQTTKTAERQFRMRQMLLRQHFSVTSSTRAAPPRQFSRSDLVRVCARCFIRIDRLSAFDAEFRASVKETVQECEPIQPQLTLRWRRVKSGYTLLELITVIAVIGAVTGVLVPELNNFYAGDVVTGEAMAMISNIRQARYRAIEEQTVHRIVFRDDLLAYKVEQYAPASLLSGPMLTGASQDSLSNYNDSNWQSIIDTDEAEFGPAVDISKDPGLPNCVFFFPNGKTVMLINSAYPLTETNVVGIPEGYIMIAYGNAGIRVVLNAHGVFASEAYAPDDDPSDDDEHPGIW